MSEQMLQYGNMTPEQVRAYPILCVDDEPANLHVFETSFSKEFTVLTAGSGLEALEILKSHKIALLFVDNRMPGMKGSELCGIVRQAYPDIRRVLVTAHASREAAIAAINEGGVHHFLTKPWAWHDVYQLLHGLISSIHLQQTARLLRQAVVAKERQATLAVTRRGYLHDLAGVSGVLAINCEMVRSRLDEVADTIGVPTVQGVYNELDRMIALVEHICSVHRKARDTSAAHPALYNGAELVTTVISLCQPDLPYGITVSSRAQGDTEFWGDRVDMCRILLNLIQNACQSIEKTGQGSRVLVTVSSDQDQTQFTVSDNGPGVPTELAESIFELNQSTRGQERGLGLYISRVLAEQNNGTLALEQGADGAKFVLTVPKNKVPQVMEPLVKTRTSVLS